MPVHLALHLHHGMADLGGQGKCPSGAATCYPDGQFAGRVARIVERGQSGVGIAPPFAHPRTIVNGLAQGRN